VLQEKNAAEQGKFTGKTYQSEAKGEKKVRVLTPI
jgi:hypothetical protein